MPEELTSETLLASVALKPARVLSATISVVTPVIGSGVRVRMVDKITLLRGNAIRGHLRFWWRAMHGVGVADMYERETEIFGGASYQGLVAISCDSGISYQSRDINRHSPLAYGAFPLLANTTPVLERKVHDFNGVARLTLELRGRDETIQKEVQDALAAWILFGGIGSRTRRGFGALQGKLDSSAGLLDIAEAKALIERAAKSVHPRVPSLHGAILVERPCAASAVAAHIEGVNRLREFRQGETWGRVPPLPGKKPRIPRNSNWPEAERIRALFRPGGTGVPATVSPMDFPRAAFGLPLAFQFMHESIEPVEIAPVAKTRWPSPVILRPIPTATGEYVPVALALSVEAPQSMELKEKNSDLNVDGVIRGPMATTNNPMLVKGATPHTDAVSAFLEYFTL